MPRLKIERRDHPASEIVLSGGDLSIGRGAGNALHFRDPWLSRLHARLYERDGRHFIEDVGSRNGSFVNGRRLARPHALVNGDVVELGDVRLSFLEEATGQLKVQDGSEASPLGKNTVIISSDELRFDDYQREAKESADTGMGAPASANAFLPALNAAASALVTYYPVDELVEKVLSLVLDAVPAERAALMLADRMSGELQIAARHGFDDREDVRLSRTIMQAVTKERQAVLTMDAQQDERFDTAMSIMMEGIRSVLCAPLVHEERGTIGLIYLDDRLASNTFSEDTLRLVGLMASLAAVKIENVHLLEDQIEKRRMEEQLALGAQIQQGLLPAEPPTIEGYSLRGVNQSCYEIGGDYFDYIAKDDGTWAIVIADISGKGVGAALLMAVLQASLRALVQSADEPAELVRRLNRVLVESSPSNKFATLFYAELDPQTHRLRYVSGGHNPSLLRVDGEVIELNSTGPIVGLVPKAEFESREVEMPPGSVLVLYTDGVTELMNEEQEEFGTDRLSALLRSGPDGSADEWVERVHEALHDFGGGERFDDDTTLLIVRRLS